ncbi:transcriptional regulator with XRE-family HTH domain [Paraburkholderia youngii]|uniref:helix-turn-helix transcriptional regulator n=1 Tax=Paraburkholderia youngii TaxID=2782701 RepID=UPI003D23F912
MYGLDLSDVCVETDYAGNRISVRAPAKIFDTLVEFWIAARRAQTAQIEASVKPGRFKVSTGNLPSGNETPAPDPTPKQAPHEKKWSELIAHMPVEPVAPQTAEPEPPVKPVEPIETKPKQKHNPSGHCFFREFVEEPPAAIREAINNGVYFMRAWREYRNLSLNDAAELMSVSPCTVSWFEGGRNPPNDRSLKRMADAYDVPIAQLTPTDIPQRHKPGPTPHIPPKRRDPAGQNLVDVDGVRYPREVLENMRRGWSPFAAWIAYLDTTVEDVAERYGSTARNLRWFLNGSRIPKPATLARLAAAIGCEPAQLHVPGSFEALDRPPEKPANGSPADGQGEQTGADANAMQAAFHKAQHKPHRDRFEILAKMQAAEHAGH